jgi:hypothetical protein
MLRANDLSPSFATESARSRHIALQQIQRKFRRSSAQTSSVDYKVTRSRPDEHCPRRTRSIRWDESRNFDANLAIEADRTRMERQVGQCWVILSRSEQFYTDVLKY